MTASPACIAFEGSRCIAAGAAVDVALVVQKRHAKNGRNPILIFDYATGQQLDFDLRGAEKDIRARFSTAPPPPAPTEDAPTDEGKRRPGRPRLGVVPREVTLLPRHWDWLNAQPGGASVALRRLVDDARRTKGRSQALRARQEAAYRFISAIAGNWPNYEEANRALFAGDAARFTELTDSWATDVRDHARMLAAAAFTARHA